MRGLIDDSVEEVRDLTVRFRLLYSIVALAVGILFIRLWYLQIIEGQELRVYSEQNRVKKTKIPAPRGLVLDREGRILVENLQGYAAVILPQYAKELDQTATALEPILNISADKTKAAVAQSVRQNGPFRPVRIRENLSIDQVFAVKLIRLDHPGLDIEETIVRHYPMGEIGAQLYGYVAEISQQQIQSLNEKLGDTRRYEQGDIIGKSGLEEVWENSLRGVDGISFIEVDAKGRRAQSTSNILSLENIPAVMGQNLTLTIDKDLQEAAAAAMNRQDHIGPRVGALVAIKNNGEVLAWISTPSYDPNKFSMGISQDIWRSLINDPNRPLRNKIIQDHYAPGSTLKPLVALAGLQEGFITEDKLVPAPGFIKYGRRIYHDHLRGGHGLINVLDAIERSSNIFFYKLGIQLEIDNLHKYLSLFRIGQKTDIGLTNEVPGILPSRQWKLRHFGEEWQPGENLSNAIGQGFVLTTVLQMAVAYNAIGLEGELYKPFVSKKLVGADDQIIFEQKEMLTARLTQPATGSTAFIKKNHFVTVKEGMRRVANGQRGTARWWKIPGIEIAGKTGTSQVMSFSADQIYDKCEDRPWLQRHHGSFVGYAPAGRPEITVAVLAEHTCHGSTGAAPVVRDVIYAYMKKYHPDWIKPDRVLAQKVTEPKDITDSEGDNPAPVTAEE